MSTMGSTNLVQNQLFNRDEKNDPNVVEAVEPAKIIAQKGSHQVLFLFLSTTGLN
jgi:hypothetical protein